MVGHSYMAFGRAWCGEAMDKVDYVTFPPNVPQCQKCVEVLAPMNRVILDGMLGKLNMIEAVRQHDALASRAAVAVFKAVLKELESGKE